LIEREVEIPASDGMCDAVFYQPEAGRVLPGVFFLTDIGGIRPSQRQMARRLGESGYAVLLPNIFYRTGRPPVFDFRANFGDERTRARMAELTRPLTPEAIERDAHAFAAYLAAQEGVAPGPMGVLGLCFSGALALRFAAALPNLIWAAASFHGGRLVVDSPTSPHLLLPRIKAQLYFGHAVEDPSMPAETIEKLNQALAAWGGRYASETYEGAYHSWTVPDSPVYNEPQAERAFAKLTELFATALH
jgi:carboxymethylenebutenolidase